MTELNDKKLCESCFEETDSDVCPKCGFSRSEFTPDPLVLPMGTRLNGKIVIGRVMGKGGFGITYLGYDLRMDKIIAVKEYYPNGIAYRSPPGTEILLTDAKSSETFDRGAEKFYAEAEMVAQFNGNPNIVSVYDYFRENNTVYLVMEYISGITLKNYVKRHGRLTDGQALYVMDKIAAALSITHSAGVLHRDISPDNIMVCMDGKVKLIDFGAARQIMAESSSNLTVVMKPGYTPIEQYTKKGRQGAWTDIYSLGVSIYYAMTEVIIEDPYARMDEDSEFDENRHGINGDLWTILKKCTMINASERYGSAIDLRKALRSVSAPIKPQPLSLDEDDLKIEETAAVPDIIPGNISEEKKFPVTAASDNGGDKAESIEIFEDSTAVPDKEEKNKKENKKGIIMGSAFAAAVIIIGIIGIIFSGKGSADEDNFTAETGTVTEAVTETAAAAKQPAVTHDYTPVISDSEKKRIVIDENSLHWSMTKSISKAVLDEFDGDIRVTLKLEPINYEKTENGDYYRTLRVLECLGKTEIDINPLGAVKNDGGEYEVNNGGSDFVFVIPHSLAGSIKEGICFNEYNVRVKSAVLEDDTYNKVLYLSGEYPGDWSVINGGIPVEELTCYDGDVRITLDLDINILGEKNDIFWGGDNFNMPMSFVHPVSDDESWTKLNISADNQLPPAYGDMYALTGTGNRQFSFTVSQEELKKHCKKKMNIQVYNCTVRNAYIEGVKGAAAEDDTGITEKPLYIPLSTEYPGRWHSDDAHTLRKDYLKNFTGDIKVTLDVELVDEDKTDEGEYNHNLKIFDDSGNIADVYALNTGRSHYNHYSLFGEQTQFAFIVKRDDFDKIHNEFKFLVENIIVRSAVAEDYDPGSDKINPDARIIQMDSRYQGFWQPSSYIPKKELESFGGDVRVTLNLEIVKATEEPAGSEAYWVQILPYGSKEHKQGWVSVKADYVYPCSWYDHMYVLYDTNVPDKFTFVISRSEIENLSDDGLYFMGSNFIIKSAALENA